MADNPEEEILQQEVRPFKRQNSRFELEREETKEMKLNTESVNYRPEFAGSKKNESCNEKIWELMSSYIGSDKKSI